MGCSDVSSSPCGPGADVSNKREATTATSGADGRKACNGVYKTVPAMIAEGGIGEGVGCGMMGLAEEQGVETCLQCSPSIDQLWWVICIFVRRRVESSIVDLTEIVFRHKLGIK